MYLTVENNVDGEDAAGRQHDRGREHDRGRQHCRGRQHDRGQRQHDKHSDHNGSRDREWFIPIEDCFQVQGQDVSSWEAYHVEDTSNVLVNALSYVGVSMTGA